MSNIVSEKLLIVNFGGPRHLKEITPFLICLLTDRDLISSRMPDFIHRWFFTKIAKKRAKKVKHDYEMIGNCSPIFEDTEYIAKAVAKEMALPFFTFHRYLSETHSPFIDQISSQESENILIFPLFPQFSYTTTGSIARWFADHLPKAVVDRFQWVRSYSNHSAYIQVMVAQLKEFLHFQNLQESETVLLFSAHGLPQSYIDKGDPYQAECERSFKMISSYFPEASSYLSYQSKFGKEEWIKPYTDVFCRSLLQPKIRDRQVIFIPLSFTSDHVETLFEVEYQYLPLIRERGLKAYRLPALNRHPDWIQAIHHIIKTSPKVSNHLLYR